MTRQAMVPGTIPNAILLHLSDGACLTIDQLEVASEFTRRQISDGASALISRQLLERVEIGCYQLTGEGLKAAKNGTVIKSGPRGADSGISRKPLPDTFRQRAWNAMRMGGSFTIGDITIAAASGDEANPNSNLERYLRALKGAGYVLELAARAPGTKLTSNGFKRFRLMKDTGPIAPVWRAKSNVLFDHNLADRGEVVTCK